MTPPGTQKDIHMPIPADATPVRHNLLEVLPIGMIDNASKGAFLGSLAASFPVTSHSSLCHQSLVAVRDSGSQPLTLQCIQNSNFPEQNTLL